MKISLPVILLLAIVALSTVAYGQERKLVVISASVGDEIDREERDFYGLFPEVINFISARFYRLGEDVYEVEIRSFEEGKIKEQVWYLTQQDFLEDFHNVINARRSPRARRHDQRGQRRQFLKIYTQGNSERVGRIMSVEEDVIYFVPATSGTPVDNTSPEIIAITDIERIAVDRSANVPATLAIGFAPAVGLGILAYATEDDPSIFLFNHDVDKRARFWFITGAVIGLSISGTLAAVRSVDRDIPFYDQTIKGKHAVLDRYHKNLIRYPAYIRAGPWIGFYYFPTDLKDVAYFPGARLSITFIPRLRLEYTYGYTQWFGKKQDKIITDYSAYPTRTNTEELKLHLIRLGLRTDLSYMKPVNPFITWGWGILYKSYNSESYNNSHFLISLEAGLERRISDWVGIEARLGVVENFDHGLQWMGQIGLHLGKAY